MSQQNIPELARFIVNPVPHSEWRQFSSVEEAVAWVRWDILLPAEESQHIIDWAAGDQVEILEGDGRIGSEQITVLEIFRLQADEPLQAQVCTA